MTDIAALLARAVAAHRAGDAAAARALYDAILKAKPRHPDALYLSGVLDLQGGRVESALTVLRRAVKAAPTNGEAFYSLGKALTMAGRADEALKTLGKARSLIPDKPDVHVELANAHLALNETGKAVAALRGGLARLPGHPALLAALGNAHGRAGEHGEAIEAFRAALAVDPERIEALAGLGLARFRLGDYEDALVCYDRALTRDPGNPTLRGNRSQSLLALGRIDEGLKDYGARWHMDTLKGRGRAFPLPAWDGAPLDHGKLLVWGEQGLGDELLYFSLLPELTKRGVATIVECDPRLEGLLTLGLDGVAVAPRRDPPDARLTAADVTAQCAGGDLLTLLGDWPGDVTRRERFIAADPVRVAGYRDWLNGLGDGLKVGIAWASKAPSMGRFKTLPLELWTPVLRVPSVDFVTLQYGDVDRDIVAAHAASGVGVHTHPELDRFDDIEGLAALIEAVDLVITTSNVTAHIAGALGKETWLVLGAVTLWYWGVRGPDNLFYPSVRAFRETESGSWNGVLAEVAAALGARTASA